MEVYIAEEDVVRGIACGDRNLYSAGIVVYGVKVRSTVVAKIESRCDGRAVMGCRSR